MGDHTDKSFALLFQFFLCADIAYITLDHFVTIGPEKGAHELDAARLPIFGVKRQRLVAEKTLLLQLPQGPQIGFPVLKQTDVPELLTWQLLMSVAQHF